MGLQTTVAVFIILFAMSLQDPGPLSTSNVMGGYSVIAPINSNDNKIAKKNYQHSDF